MSLELIWRAAPDGTTHHAVVLGDDLGEDEVRTACGRSFRPWDGEEAGADAEVTCTACGGVPIPQLSRPLRPAVHRPQGRRAAAPPAPTPSPLPYGIFELNPRLVIDRGPPERVKCCIRGCTEALIPPSRWRPGEACPVHGIKTHASATYSYLDPRRNTIVAPDLLARIVRQPFKFESGRFGYERGEDMLSFNVFRSFQEARFLHLVARFLTGQDIDAEPRLFLWGLELTDDSLQPWDLLIAARQRFESHLPVKRPATEPDIALFQPSRFLILCEAKFCSENPVYVSGPRKDKQSLTKQELVDIYDDPALEIIDRDKAARSNAVPYQLFRNMQFAEYMAQLDGPNTLPFLANLTRQGHENASFESFSD